LFNHGHGFIGALPALGVVGQPAAELLVQSGLLGARPLAGGLDQPFIGTKDAN